MRYFRLAGPRTTLAATLALAAAFQLLAVGVAEAKLVNPAPGFYADDDHAQVFAPFGGPVAFTGLSPLAGLAATGLFGSGLPGTAVPLLTAADPVGTTVAVLFGVAPGVNLAAGGSYVPPHPFTLPPGGISFFLSVPELSLFLSTDDVLNPGGLRLAATYPSRTVPGQYLIEFGVPDPSGGADTPLALVVVTNIAAVPEPASWAVLAAGLGLAAALRRRAAGAAGPG